MPKAVKVSISLPSTVLAAAERERATTGESRSELFRRAVEDLLRSARERAAVDQYVAGYVAEPEADYEVESADGAAAEALTGGDW